MSYGRLLAPILATRVNPQPGIPAPPDQFIIFPCAKILEPSLKHRLLARQPPRSGEAGASISTFYRATVRWQAEIV